MSSAVVAGPPLPVELVAFSATNMDDLLFDDIARGITTVLTDDQIRYNFQGDYSTRFYGEFDYSAPDVLTGGVLHEFQGYVGGNLQLDINRLNVPIETILDFMSSGQQDSALALMFDGADKLKGSIFGDLLRGYNGNDTIWGGTGADTLFGGEGDDQINDGLGSTIAHGDGGNDSIYGGSLADDLYGDAGDDLLKGYDGNDYISGGNGNDDIQADGGQDFADGGLGDDTLSGSLGADTLIGSGGNDLIDGGEGADWISGGPGSDVITGGAGADVFQFSSGSGVDRIKDFNPSEDRIQLAPDGPYEFVEIAGSTVIRHGTSDQLTLVGVPLSAITASSTFSAWGPTSLSGPTSNGAVAIAGVARGVDMSALDLTNLLFGDITTADAGLIVVDYGGGARDEFRGNFTYNVAGKLVVGAITQVTEYSNNALLFDVRGISVSAATFVDWIVQGDTLTAFNDIFRGADSFTGSPFADRLFGYAGADRLLGGAGTDTLNGGEGEDYVRGEDGDDVLFGGAGFDDINGNAGNDVAHGEDGDDWVVGGKDNDQLYGDAGLDIVWGNLGNDTLDGGSGADQVRGGQGNDVVNGGAGDDFVSGDRGADTETGGAGADLFHSSQDAGVDRVLDFRQSEGDRVMLDPGTTYALSQVAGDTVIDMGGGNQVILVGVQLSTLATGWIFVG